MELTSYLVKQDDTLSEIAQQHGTSVEQLRQLNRFIKYPDIIQPGWNLSVPAQGGATATASATPSPLAPANAESSPEPSPTPSDILELDENTKPKPSKSVCFAPQKDLPCSKVYADIIYATNEKEFWLLSAEAASALKEAASKLDKMLAPGKSAQERQKALYASGLLDYFMEPKLANFLKGEQQARMLEIEVQEPLIDNPRYAMQLRTAEEAKQRDIAAKNAGPVDPYEERDKPWQDNQRDLDNYKKYRQLQALHSEWKKLSHIAETEAKRQGYIIEDGTLFTPEAIKAREIVQTYLKARAKLLDDKGQLSTFSDEDIADVLQVTTKLKQNLDTCLFECNAQLHVYRAMKTEQTAKFAYPEYLDAILKAADYGIALPEFALSQDGNIKNGVEAIKNYLALQLEQTQTKQRLFDKYEAWIKASGENTKAPDSLVAVERAEWNKLQGKLEAKKHEAEQNVNSTVPRRHLLWEPEQFKPAPVERLVKPDLPLREISLPANSSPVRHISMTVLKSLKDESEVKWDGNSKGKAKGDQVHSDFQQWLKALGSVPIEDQGAWFDKEGGFDIEQFHTQLNQKGYEVKTLASADQRKMWGDQLRQMLFEKEAQREMRLFDTSPQAQLIRCLTPKITNVQHEASAKTEFSTKGAEASTEAHLEINLAMGEVELFKLDWPDRNSAQDIKIKYQSYDGQRVVEMNIGRFSFNVGARAWGYAGAAMMVAAQVSLTPNNIRYGAGISPIEDAKKNGSLSLAQTNKSTAALTGVAAKVKVEDGASASFNLFAGIQAGIHLSGALYWVPPKDLVALRMASLQSATASEWLSLARLEGDIGASVGMGASGEFSLSVDRGQLIMRIRAALVCGAGAKGSFAFQVGYDGIYDLLNLFRRELHKNNGQPLDWVDGSAMDLFSKMNLLGLAGLDPYMLYLVGFDKIAELCEALTAKGKGGPVAHTIMNYQNLAELEQWTIEAIPEALGPMLMTLLYEAEEFDVVSYRKDQATDEIIKTTAHYSESECWMLQQKAIDRLLGWVVDNAKKSGKLTEAQTQFEEACMRMNRFGAISENSNQSYCENRFRMDAFMAEGVERLHERRSDAVRRNYKSNVTLLGAIKDRYCESYNIHGTFYNGSFVKYTGGN